ncbi:MAG: hypothetical protein ABUL77_02495 [Bacteroidota bacterium]
MSLYCDILSRADAFPSQRQGARASALDSLARAAVIAIAALVSVFAAWQFVMPETFVSVRGLNPLAVAAWRAHLGWHPAFVSLPVYTAVFRGLIALPFAAYALLLWCVARGARIDFRFALALAAVLCLALAVAMPASLSTDVFAYVGYGRLRVVHGLNPHLATQVDLVRLGDPTAPYLHWPIPSPYGPLWTLLSMALVALAPAQSVWGVVVAFKLGAALAVLAAGAAGRATVGRLAAAEAGAIGDRVAPGTPVPPGSAPRADAIFAAIASRSWTIASSSGTFTIVEPSA